MKADRFWMYLLTLSVLTALGVYFTHKIDIFQPHQVLYWIYFGFMLFTTVVLFYLGTATSLSSNKYSFIQMVVASILLKIVLFLVILIIYLKYNDTDNRYFVFPVLGIYLIFSIFETIVLYRLALNKPKIQS